MEMLAIFDVDQVRNWMEVGGYFLLFAMLFSCGLGVPIPEDIPLTLAGFFVAQGKMNLAIASVVAWCGIIGGDCVLYHLGKTYGLNITKLPMIGKHVTRARIEKAEHLFEHYGIWVVGIGRMFAGIRGAMVVAAGTIRYNFVRFVIADGLAALVSGGLFVALGHWGGRKIGDPQKFFDEVVTPYKHWFFVGMVVVAAVIALYIWWRRKRHKTLADVAMAKAEHVVEND